jgi:hypothetical protein
MKIVYLIQTYRNPEQIYRLARTLAVASSNAFILICHDRSSCDLSSVPLHTLPNVEVIFTKQRIMRGRFSLVQAYLDSIEWLFTKTLSSTGYTIYQDRIILFNL